MTNATASSYDVLLLESHPHVADQAAIDLAAAGHRIHRCHEQGQQRSLCAALQEGGHCPIDDGIDVAVLVRSPLVPLPTYLEDGATCAHRAGIPIVEQGPAELDPWARWIAARVDADSRELALVTAGVAREVDTPAHAAIQRVLAPLLRSAGMDERAIDCRLERSGANVSVHVTLPSPADRALRSAIGVRVLDGLRAASTKTLGNVDVYVHPSLESPGS
jgi:hypothetical protein